MSTRRKRPEVRQVNFRVPVSIYERFRDIAYEKGESVNGMLNKLITAVAGTSPAKK